MKSKNPHISDTTLQDIIDESCNDPEFRTLFAHEQVINRISELVHRVRKQSRLSQKELALRAHTTQPVIARLESGKAKNPPTVDLLFRIAQAAGKNLEISFK